MNSLFYHSTSVLKHMGNVVRSSRFLSMQTIYIRPTFKISTMFHGSRSPLYFSQLRRLTNDSVPVANDGESSSTIVPQQLEKKWSWVPPRSGSEIENDSSIPVIPGKLLTLAEMSEALAKQGGENIVEIELKTKLDTITHTIIVTGSSKRQLRKMADSIVAALKARGLEQAPGFTGVEGADDDDWLLVDCYDSAVHFMLKEARDHIKLEEHLLSDDKPTINFTGDEAEYEKAFEDLLDKYPVPEGYNPYDADRAVQNKSVPESVAGDFGNNNNSANKKKNSKPVVKFPKANS